MLVSKQYLIAIYLTKLRNSRPSLSLGQERVLRNKFRQSDYEVKLGRVEESRLDGTPGLAVWG